MSALSGLSEKLLPEVYQLLLIYFDVIDQAYNFLSKAKIRCSIANLSSMYGSLVSVTELIDMSAWKVFSPFPLFYLVSFICPDEFRLMNSNCDLISIPPDMVDPQPFYALELSYKTLNSIGKQASKQRRRNVLEGLWERVKQQFLQTHGNINAKIISIIKKEGWKSFGGVPNPVLPGYMTYVLSSPSPQPEEIASPCSCKQGDLDIQSPTPAKPDENTSDIPHHTYPIPPSCPFHSLLTHIEAQPMFYGQITHIHTLPAVSARLSTLQPSLPPDLRERLNSMFRKENVDDLDGISSGMDQEECNMFYTHQVEGIQAIRQGKHLTLTSPPSSGKTLTYLLPILEAMRTDASCIALLMFPTKALTQDQFRSMSNFIFPTSTVHGQSYTSLSYAKPVILDGDTPRSGRREIQGIGGKAGVGNLILTNPDMLHCTIMPEHKSWKRIFSNLRFVVLDEAHTYRGIFGTHISLVLRRLIRLTLRYRNHPTEGRRTNIPQFILLSGTVVNPLQMMAGLLPLVGLYEGLPRPSRAEDTKIDAESSDHRNKSETPTSDDLGTSPTILDILSNENLFDQKTRQVVEDYCNARVVDSNYDGAPRGERVVVFWNPPLKSSVHASADDQQCRKVLDFDESFQKDRVSTEEYKYNSRLENLPSSPGTSSASPSSPDRLSAIYEISQLLEILIIKGVRTLAFCGVRRCVELVYKYVSTLLTQHKREDLIPLLASYRGGYSKEERREIEHQLFSEQLVAVAATCALELGIDIGSMECTLHLGMPGTGSAFAQQMGRAGRKTQPSLHIVVAFNSPIDQYYIHNPDKLFVNKQLAGERVVVNVDNVYTLRHHLVLAAKEVPLNFPLVCRQDGKSWTVCDCELWGEEYEDSMEYLLNSHKLYLIKEQDLANLIRNSSISVGDGGVKSIKDFYPVDPKQNQPKSRYRANLFTSAVTDVEKVSLRQIDPVTFTVVVEGTGEVLDTVGYSRAFYELFEQAIYMHRGKQYLVVKLDMINYIARVKLVNVKYYTAASDRASINIVKVLQLDENGTESIFNYGIVQVVKTVYGYSKHSLYSHFAFEKGECQLPPMEYETQAFWLCLPALVKSKLEEMGHNVTIAVHSANHAVVSLLPSVLACDPGDICTEHLDSRAHNSYNRLLFFDKPMGGIGLAKTLYLQHKVGILRDAHEMLCRCQCTDGCPVCVYHHRCGNYNGECSKQGAIALLQLLLSYCTETTSRKRKDLDVAEGMASTPQSHGRRQQRRTSQHYATLRDSGAAIQKSWTNLVPNFVCESNEA
eukprot:gene25938-31324_t